MLFLCTQHSALRFVCFVGWGLRQVAALWLALIWPATTRLSPGPCRRKQPRFLFLKNSGADVVLGHPTFCSLCRLGLAQVVDRLLGRFVNEAVLCLQEGTRRASSKTPTTATSAPSSAAASSPSPAGPSA